MCKLCIQWAVIILGDICVFMITYISKLPFKLLNFMKGISRDVRESVKVVEKVDNFRYEFLLFESVTAFLVN